MTALTITISRTSLSLSPLVLSGSADSNDYGVTAYVPPSLQSRLMAMPDSADVDGTEYIAASWQQAILGFDFIADTATTETLVQAGYAEVAAAIGQFSFTVTTVVSGAPAQVWAANRGSINLKSSSGREYRDLVNLNPEYSVSIPVYPIAGS